MALTLISLEESFYIADENGYREVDSIIFFPVQVPPDAAIVVRHGQPSRNGSSPPQRLYFLDRLGWNFYHLSILYIIEELYIIYFSTEYTSFIESTSLKIASLCVLGRNAKIERVHLDGSGRKKVIGKNIYWPNGVTIDYTTDTLYWVDAKMLSVDCSNLDGLERRKVISEAKILDKKRAF